MRGRVKTKKEKQPCVNSYFKFKILEKLRI